MVDDGAKYKVAADAVGVSVRFIGKWIDARRKHGDAGLDGGKRGRRPGEQQVIDTKVAERIRRKIIDKCPDQLKLPFALWTREAVRDLILKETGIRLSLQAVSNYLARWNMTPQRPAKRAKEQSAAAVKQWLERDYPSLLRRAKREKAEIQWADETGISNQANYGRSFAPRGQTPVQTRPAVRFTQSMISGVTNQGKLRFMIYAGALNVAIFLRFLQRLVRDATRKIFLVVDNLRVHRAKKTMAWVVENKDRIELVFLPAYAPQHNPDEYLNNDVKQALARRETPKDKAAMKGALTSYMRGLQKRPSKVKSFFQALTVRYAA